MVCESIYEKVRYNVDIHVTLNGQVQPPVPALHVNLDGCGSSGVMQREEF